MQTPFNKQIFLWLFLLTGLFLNAQEKRKDSVNIRVDSVKEKKQDIFDYEHSRKFADYLYKTGQYDYAIEEYQRTVFINPGDNQAKYNLVDTNLKKKDYPSAQNYFLRFFPVFDTLDTPYQKLYVKIFVFQNDYADAMRYLKKSSLDSVHKQTWILGLTVLTRQWDKALKYYNAHPDNPDPVYHQFGSAVQRRLEKHNKSPLLAAGLSTVVPGLGKVYTKNYGDALMALLFTGLNVWQAWRGFSKNGVKSVRGWIFAGIGTSFYLGNIFGSAKAAKRYNKKLDDQATDEVKAVFQYNF